MSNFAYASLNDSFNDAASLASERTLPYERGNKGQSRQKQERSGVEMTSYSNNTYKESERKKKNPFAKVMKKGNIHS